MERVLLWLDELDDCLACVAIWFRHPARLRRPHLQAGLVLGLVLVEGTARSNFLVSALGALAAGALVLWAGAAAATLAGRRSAHASRRGLEMQ